MAFNYGTFFVISFILVLMFLGNFSPEADDLSSSEEEFCMACTTKINNSLAKLGKHFSSFNKMEFNYNPPCTPCEIAGLRTMLLVEQVCPQSTEADGKTCYDHALQFFFKELVMTCTCTLPFDPQKMLNMMAEQQMSGNTMGFDTACMKEGKPPIDPKILATGAIKSDPTSFLKLVECRPKTPTTLFGQKEVPEEVTGGVKMSIKDFQLQVVFRACKDKKDVQTVKILRDENMDTKLHIECVATTDENFLVPCKCLGKTQFLSQLFVSSTSSAIPCQGSQVVDKDVDFTSHLVCLELV